jgi:pyridoxamine 5'-phosphate oxidase
LRAVLASRNRHKAEQVAALLPDVELVSLDEVAPDLELDEPFDSFEANSLAKARTVARQTHMPAVADDSGLEVDALGGEPGVFSARYAGEGASDDDNNRKLVARLRDVPERDRTCRYRCVAALVTPDGHELVAEGSCEGLVVLEGRGKLGFGYDPYVVPAGETRTMGEIPLDEKLRFSHRGRAFRALAEKMRILETSAEAEHLQVERGLAALDESDVDPDPFRQFELWIRDALEREPGEPNAMTLATATRDGRPSARMVLLRGFDDRGFVFYTNYGSRKGRELDENPQAALVFYWGSRQRQVCITGRVTRLAEKESSAYFDSRPRGHQLGAWASRQSQIISSRASLEERVRDLESAYEGIDDIPRPPQWGGFRLAPDTIEFWQGRPNRLHDRLRFSRTDTGWVLERLAP